MLLDNQIDISKELMDFIKESPTAFHVVKNFSTMLEKAGFIKLNERNKWKIEQGGKYYVTRNDSSIIAFQVPDNMEFYNFQIAAAHSDSPAFKIKENPEMVEDNNYVTLNVEKYGGMLMAPWFDRPLSVAGRVIVREDSGLKPVLVNVDRDLCVIPNLAIHMNRDVNNGIKYNPQKDMIPLFGEIASKDKFEKIIAMEAGTDADSIVSADLFLYNREVGKIWGADNEFMSAPRLDDVMCAFSCIKALTDNKENSKSVNVCAIFDNEEVGSTTRQGAASAFLKDVLYRINLALGGDHESYLMALAESFMISADNAHALHPNYTDKADPVNRPTMNGGIVIKYNANQKYCTDGISAAIFKELCREAEVPYQTFVNRSDIAGGSTLGNISNTQAAMNTVDIGLPQLAMHSAYETAGVKDTESLIRAAKVFYR